MGSAVQLQEGKEEANKQNISNRWGNTHFKQKESKKLMEMVACLKSYKWLFFSLEDCTVSMQNNEEMN